MTTTWGSETTHLIDEFGKINREYLAKALSFSFPRIQCMHIEKEFLPNPRHLSSVDKSSTQGELYPSLASSLDG